MCTEPKSADPADTCCLCDGSPDITCLDIHQTRGSPGDRAHALRTSEIWGSVHNRCCGVIVFRSMFDGFYPSDGQLSNLLIRSRFTNFPIKC